MLQLKYFCSCTVAFWLYGIAVVKSKEICVFIDPCFNTEMALPMSKDNSLVLFFSETNYHDWGIRTQNFVKKNNKNKKNKINFATVQFGTLPVFLTSINGSGSFAIRSSP